MNPLVVPSSAKLNLFLAITGRRADGFHDLVSVAAPVEFGDTLTVDPRPAGFTLTCDDPSLPTDETNLVLRAARAFVRATGWAGGAHFTLAKRIPAGAGLGGGSSNAAAVLRALNKIAGGPLDETALGRVAGEVGSDCPLFLRGGPVVMRGRGEAVEAICQSATKRLRGRRMLIFKPPFAISTVWAYRQMAAGAPATYLAASEAEARLARWSDDSDARAEALLFNNMEAPAFAKYITLPTALTCLRDEFGFAPRMSGSGSACFAFLSEDAPVQMIVKRICALWGPDAFVVETRLA